MVAFQNWSRIDITFLLSAEVTKELVDVLKLRLDYIVIVVPPRISCDPSRLSCSRGPVGRVPLKIIQRQHNDRSRPWQNLLRIATLFFPASHIVHFAVRAFAQPFAKFVRVRGSRARSHATRIETNLSRKGYELRLQFRSRNLGHGAVAGIGDPGCGLSLAILLKIATATSSSVSTDVSTRRCAIFA